ncbi:MAG: HAMP domain-containing histidine kinase [Magnetococcales bacterium]|nr:HAMP domain-containing histidine kinase [Magnetococcales bacterium]
MLVLEQQAELAEKRISDNLMTELIRQLVESERQLNDHKEHLIQAKEILEIQNRKLIESDQLKQDVELITRHDMKSPLNGLIGYSDILLEEAILDADQKAHVQKIRKAGVTILHMINLSLGLYRMEQGVYQLEPKEIDLIPIIYNINHDLQVLIAGNRLTLRVTMQGVPLIKGGLFRVRGEEVLCYSMLANLIKNALEASPEKGIVTVDLSKEAGTAIITIHNSGAVPEKIRDSFFEKYSSFGKLSGTGLGTYSAKLISEAQGGSIRMITSEEHGTQIIVHMPAVESVESPTLSDPVSVGLPATLKHTVDMDSLSQTEPPRHMEVLQLALKNRHLEQAMKAIIGLRSSASEVGSARISSQMLRLQGKIEMEEWDDAQTACEKLVTLLKNVTAIK